MVPATFEVYVDIIKSLHYDFPKMWAGQRQFGTFRKFISFGTVTRPLLKPSRLNKLPLTFVIPMTPHVQCKTRKMVTKC